MLKKARKIICKVLCATMIFSSVAVTPQLSFAAAESMITVGKGSEYDYDSIQEALDSISFKPTANNKVTISISEGEYEEFVTVNTPYVKFENADSENPEDVVITYDYSASHEDPAKRFGTQDSATVTIAKDAVGFEANNITFQNSYNLDQPDLGDDGLREQTQAVALVTLTDKVVFENCNFIGRQDTLYLKGASLGQNVYGEASPARVYLKDCYIEGTVDYIFGDATAVFENCHLNLAYYRNGGHYTAANTTLFNLGYVFVGCKLTVDDKYNNFKGEDVKNIDLGRPWQGDDAYPNYGSHTAFINCELPDYLIKEGWSVWNNATITNKIRYMEYGSVDKNRKSINLESRVNWAKNLTEEQAKVYTAENILKGDDNWNPKGSKLSKDVKVLDVTLNKHLLEIPKGEEAQLKAYVLPSNAVNKNVGFLSSNKEVAEVDQNGNITAIKKGKATITVITEDGEFYSSCDVEVLAPRTNAPIVKEVGLSKTADVKPGDVLVGNYVYNLPTDMEIDNALMQWQVSDESGSLTVKEGRGDYFKSYTVDSSDVGCQITFKVIPETTTSYGSKGTAVTAILDSVVSVPEGEYEKALIKEDFSNFLQKSKEISEGASATVKWIASNDLDDTEIGSWKMVGNTIASALTENCLLEYNSNGQKGYKNSTTEVRMRFNPDISGFSSNDYFNIYTNYNKENGSYYKLKIGRGSNTNSLNLFLYKKAEKDSEEVLLAAEEEKLGNKVPQNSGDGNPWFRIKQSVFDGKIKVEFTLEGDAEPSAILAAEDSSPIKEGFVAFESKGKVGVLLLDFVNVKEKLIEPKNEVPIKVYLAGDSTVKTYGDSRTVGGWGEYLQYYFDEDNVEIINHAEGGRSARSFINQARLEKIKNEINTGDYLFIQFGHNDSSDGEDYLLERYVPLGEPYSNGTFPVVEGQKITTPNELLELSTGMPYAETFYPYTSGTFKWYLKEFILVAKEKGATPVLVTPVSRMYFDENGEIKSHHGENDGYVEAVKQLAEEESVPVIDMFEVTKNHYAQIGERKAELFHDIKSDAAVDKTHYSKYGGFVVGGMFADEVKNSSLGLGEYVTEPTKIIQPTENLRNSTAFLVGDSTVCLYDEDASYALERGGWGMYLGDYLTDNIEVSDLALSGRSSKSFTAENNYEILLESMKEGDYLFIQFGHNDAKNSTDEDKALRYTDPEAGRDVIGSFKNYLYEYYVAPAKEKKVQPILISPVSRRNFDDEEKVKDSHGKYDDAVRELAAECNIPFIDLTSITEDYYNSLGLEGTKVLHSVYKDSEKGSNGIDNTHFNRNGARKIAQFVVKELPGTEPTIKNYVDYQALNSTKYMTRADFIVNLLRVMGVEETSDSAFNDLSTGKYYTNSISVAKDKGYISADDNGNIRPEEYIKWTEVAEILNIALNANFETLNILSDIPSETAVTSEYVTFNQGFNVLIKVYEYLYASK